MAQKKPRGSPAIDPQEVPLEAPSETGIRDEPADPLTEFSKLAQEESCRIYVWRFNARGEKELVDRIPFEEFEEWMLAEKWGGGVYTLQLRDAANRFLKQATIRIAGQPRAVPLQSVQQLPGVPGRDVRQGVDRPDVIDSEARQLAQTVSDLRRELDHIRREQRPDPGFSLKDLLPFLMRDNGLKLTDLMPLIGPLMQPREKTPIAEIVEGMQAVRQIAKDSGAVGDGSGGGADESATVASILGIVKELVAAGAQARREQQAQPPAAPRAPQLAAQTKPATPPPPAAPLPPPTGATAPTPAAPVDPPAPAEPTPSLAMIVEMLLIGAAQEDPDLDSYASVLYDVLASRGEASIIEDLPADTVRDLVLDEDPRLVPHRDFVLNVALAAKELIAPDSTQPKEAP